MVFVVLLEVKHIAKSFGEREVLKDVNLSLEEGSTSALVGTNGAGKTVLFNIITGFLSANKGEVLLNESNIVKLPPHRINLKGIGRTFQDLRLATNLTVLENVMLAFKDQPGEKWWNAMLPLAKNKRNQTELREKAELILEKAFIKDVAQHLADEISYGQQKLLTMACLMANDAKVFLLDEPVAGINPVYRDKMTTLFKEFKDLGKTILLIEHNADFIESVSDKVFFLNEGVIQEFDTYSDLRNDELVKEAYV